MVVVDIEDDRNISLESGLRAIAFVDFCNQQLTIASCGRAFPTIHSAADQVAGFQSSFSADMRNHRCCRGLAMRAGNCDRAGETLA